MSGNSKNVSVNGVWSIPWGLVGLILYFGTSTDNTWWGIHTHYIGGLLLVLSLVFFGLMVAFLLVVLAIVAIANGSRRF